ncbi:hypothetical protein [Pandoraea sp.]|uniref:hypothetical protein n=1 Tax=Pandoraea sp. TaxID=1883445 RepID=UPI0011FB9083|nr:hypothetical protein [Pandoraea sp.]TAL57348.1 MAG: hypothetical protein EPN80_00835 [Pandoraea sp.]TAM16403.1 MAG: hypothetical protein EPN65_13945 [Pandoraea sp.]
MNTPGLRYSRAAVLALLLCGAVTAGLAQGMHTGATEKSAKDPGADKPRSDPRALVQFPPEVKRETLATMRMHLQGLAEIQQAMAAGDLDAAARVASMKLGMSSMHGDQAQQEARYMPPGMRELGARLHRQAGEFALVAQDAAATGDVRKAQVMLGQMMQTCVACHAAYRLK